MPEGEEPSGRLLGVDRPAPLFEQLDEPIRRVQSQLHGKSLGEHTFVCNDRTK